MAIVNFQHATKSSAPLVEKPPMARVESVGAMNGDSVMSGEDRPKPAQTILPPEMYFELTVHVLGFAVAAGIASRVIFVVAGWGNPPRDWVDLVLAVYRALLGDARGNRHLVARTPHRCPPRG